MLVEAKRGGFGTVGCRWNYGAYFIPALSNNRMTSVFRTNRLACVNSAI